MKRISPATVTVGMLAILLGLVAAYVARRALENTPPAEQRGVAFVVPRVNLVENTRIRVRDLRVVRRPVEKIPAGAIRSPGVLVNRVVKTTLTAGQAIFETALYSIGETPSIADQLPPGYRAVTIAVTGENAGGRLARSGAQVDVALTVEGDHPGLDLGVGTMTLLRNVKVLSGPRRAARSRRRGNQGSGNITLAVTPVQANKLILAQRYGTLNVTLCSSVAAEDESTDFSPIINPRELLGLAPIEPEYTVEVWRGEQRKVITLSLDLVHEAHDATIADERRQQNTKTLPTKQDKKTTSLPAPANRPVFHGMPSPGTRHRNLRITLRRSSDLAEEAPTMVRRLVSSQI